jgi:hypothetical protein
VTIHTDLPAGDLSRLRIDRDAPPRNLNASSLKLAMFIAPVESPCTRTTPGLLLDGLIPSAVMGAVGGLLPALRAARIPVARAPREI